MRRKVAGEVVARYLFVGGEVGREGGFEDIGHRTVALGRPHLTQQLLVEQLLWVELAVVGEHLLFVLPQKSHLLEVLQFDYLLPGGLLRFVGRGGIGWLIAGFGFLGFLEGVLIDFVFAEGAAL